MEFFEAVEKRRSIRKFKTDKFEDEKVQKALEAAVLAPNSSNTQTWDFYWVKSDGLKKKVVEACLNQSAARTANQLVVVTADPTHWRRSQDALKKWVRDSEAPKAVFQYYDKVVPFTYSWGFLNLFAVVKIIMSFTVGMFRPMLRGPHTRRDIEEVAIKSAALAAENFVLAITAQGGASCMMEGFDDKRLRDALKLPSTRRIVMVIGVGYEGERGTWGPRFRLPLSEVIHEV